MICIDSAISRLLQAAFLVSLISITGALAADQQEISLQTRDGLTIKATLHRPDATGKLPAVVLIHQGGSDRTEWDAFVPKFLHQSYVTLAYDVRGHGHSDKVKSIGALFNDPTQAPLDLQAVLHYLASLEFVDAERIAVVGSSVGANLACVAAGRRDYHIKTAVAISGKTTAVLNLAGKKEDDFKMASVFFISSMENDGQRATWALELYKKTADPRQIEIVEQSRAHGVGIFKDAPGLPNQIIAWLQKTL